VRPIVAAVALMVVVANRVSAQSVSLAGGLHMDPDAIRDWKVPWDKTVPRDPFADQQGHVWFVGQMGNYVARLDPARGEFKRYEIDAGTYPHDLVVDRQNSVWFTGNRNGRIVHLDPQTG
jgi:virginiamycin B lyase